MNDQDKNGSSPAADDQFEKEFQTVVNNAAEKAQAASAMGSTVDAVMLTFDLDKVVNQFSALSKRFGARLNECGPNPTGDSAIKTIAGVVRGEDVPDMQRLRETLSSALGHLDAMIAAKTGGRS